MTNTTPNPDRKQAFAANRHYHLKLDYGKPSERIVSFSTQAERLAAAKAALREERRSV